ncbi:MAG: hypothetical protein CVU00_06775 [Bacteroidetes bacterium HGW-Bacteroidetes-17]|jgi:hypothetical protein|nr:MAG: hypothetical protein CVU00_06775 [Bacteroidetes bacterium HGW-Bacteroidetes-17]
MKNLNILLVLLLFGSAVQGQEEKSETTFSHKGYYNATNFGILAGSTKNENKAPFSFMMINGYGVTDQIAVGIGFGAEFLQESYLPLVLDARYYFRKQKLSPFIFFQGGYSVPLDNETERYHLIYYSSIWSGYDIMKPKGGWLINPGVGIKSMFSENLGITFSIAYRFQRLNYDKDGEEFDKVLVIDMNRLEIKLGILFK